MPRAALSAAGRSRDAYWPVQASCEWLQRVVFSRSRQAVIGQRWTMDTVMANG